jgi:TRAP-type mannitol/chloroaromatic compound transport system permease small subunit
MKTLKAFIDLFFILYYFALTCFLSFMIITAGLNGWRVTLDINRLGEGWLELIMIPLLTLAGIPTLIKCIDIIGKNLMEGK